MFTKTMEFTVVREFNGMILNGFRREGYKFLKKERFEEGISLLTPLYEDDPTAIADTYTIPIDDDQADEMARGVNTQEFYVL
jgi:hypothetical protein